MAVTKDNTDRFIRLARKAAVDGVTAGAEAVRNSMRIGMSTGTRLTPSAPGSAPNVQRGQLRNPITSTRAVIGQDGLVRAAAGTNLVYGGIHERGGTIMAKRGRFIPVPLNLEARRLSETVGKGGLRSKDMFVMRTPRGKLLLVGKSKVRYRNKESGIRLNGEPVFVLVKSVRMPKRPWAAPGLARARADGSLYKAIFLGAKGAIQSFNAGVST